VALIPNEIRLISLVNILADAFYHNLDNTGPVGPWGPWIREALTYWSPRPQTPKVGSLDDVQMQKIPLHLAAALLALPLLTPIPAQAQKRIPKLPGYDQCPLGYVNDLKQHCNSPIYYQVKPTYGKPCLSGWMNIGAGYCKKKTLGIF
jgi:hypothetical protein